MLAQKKDKRNKIQQACIIRDEDDGDDFLLIRNWDFKRAYLPYVW